MLSMHFTNKPLCTALLQLVHCYFLFTGCSFVSRFLTISVQETSAFFFTRALVAENAQNLRHMNKCFMRRLGLQLRCICDSSSTRFLRSAKSHDLEMTSLQLMDEQNAARAL